MIPITRDSIEKYSSTTCIHCNDLYFDLWSSIKNIKEKSEEYLKKIFEKKCDRCIDADEIRSRLRSKSKSKSRSKSRSKSSGDTKYSKFHYMRLGQSNFLGLTRRGI